MKYDIEVTRITYARQSVAIEADSEEQAGREALHQALEEGEFSTYCTAYEVSSVAPAPR